MRLKGLRAQAEQQSSRAANWEISAISFNHNHNRNHNHSENLPVLGHKQRKFIIHGGGGGAKSSWLPDSVRFLAGC